MTILVFTEAKSGIALLSKCLWKVTVRLLLASLLWLLIIAEAEYNLLL